MAENAPRDQNYIPAALFEISGSNRQVMPGQIDQVSGRILVDNSGGGSGTVTEVDTGTGLTGGPITSTGTIALDSKLAPLDTLGSPGQSVRVNAGMTALEYYTPGAAVVPGGSNLQVQYNNSGAFGGISGVISNGTSIQISSGDLLLEGSGSGGVTLNAPATGGGTLTLPPGTDTVLGAASTATLTNKTFDTAGTGNVFDINGVAVTANTGTGAVARATSPTFVTPVLGAATGTSLNLSGLTASSAVATDASKNLVSVANTGTGSNVLAVSPALTGTPTAPTQTTGDNTTAIATDAFVTTAIANAIAGVDPAVAVVVATTAAGDTSGLTYNNGVSGVGATFTGSTNTALAFDGVTLTSLAQRVLVKNDTQSPSGAFNGIYTLTQIQTAILPPILTRALDYNTPSNINSTGAIPVLSGTVNALTSWLLNTTVVTIGTTPITYTQFSFNPSRIIPATLGGTGIANNVANTLTYSGNFGITETLTGTTSVTFPTSGTLVSSVTTGNGVSATNTGGALAFTLGAITPTTVNGNTFTTGTYTLTGTAAKTLNFTNSLTLSGTDSTTMTFPATSATVAGLGTTQTFTGQDKFNNFIDVNNAVTVTSNAGTVPVTFRLNTFTNSSAAAMTITLATASAVDGQMTIVRIYDATGGAEGITWVNTENSTVTPPATSNGSTTSPLTVGFMFNSATTKWRCIASA